MIESSYLDKAEGDYPGLCLFKTLLLQTWFSLSDQSVSDALQRDLVFMRFCGLSVDGNKPTASTICRFRQRLIASGQLSLLLTQLNDQQARRGLKLANGKS